MPAASTNCVTAVWWVVPALAALMGRSLAAPNVHRARGVPGPDPGWCKATGAIIAGASVASNAVRRRALWILVGAVMLTAVGAAVVYAATRPDGNDGSATVAQLQDGKRRAEATRIARRRWFAARKADLLRQIHAAKARNEAAAPPPQPAGERLGARAADRALLHPLRSQAQGRNQRLRPAALRHLRPTSSSIPRSSSSTTPRLPSSVGRRPFATDPPDSELHELPETCAHFVIDTDGTSTSSSR